MYDDQRAERRNHPEEDKPFLADRMLWIGDRQRLVILEDRPSLLEVDPVLPRVGGSLGRPPFEFDAN